MDQTRPSDKTRAAEAVDARTQSESDDMPTPAEEAAADRADEIDEDVEQHYEEMAERGAEQKGEGRLP